MAAMEQIPQLQAATILCTQSAAAAAAAQTLMGERADLREGKCQRSRTRHWDLAHQQGWP
jgi:hypothetical protein